jgi:hypothetical protein
MRVLCAPSCALLPPLRLLPCGGTATLTWHMRLPAVPRAGVCWTLPVRIRVAHTCRRLRTEVLTRQPHSRLRERSSAALLALARCLLRR